jgi:hypothetical protein
LIGISRSGSGASIASGSKKSLGCLIGPESTARATGGGERPALSDA